MHSFAVSNSSSERDFGEDCVYSCPMNYILPLFSVDLDFDSFTSKPIV